MVDDTGDHLRNALGRSLADLLSDSSSNTAPKGSPSQTNALWPSFSDTSSNPSSNALTHLLAQLDGGLRTRSQWNDRFLHWERPASVSEAGTLERARSLVSQTIASNQWLRSQGVTVSGQGSYFNNTNVRTEADIDIRIVHPNILIEYAPNVTIPYASTALGYSDAPLTFGQIFAGLRTNLATDLRNRFGAANVGVGNKAIRLKGVTGSRAEVDIVPAVQYHWVCWLGDLCRYETLRGIAILGRDGRWTVNFPEQHAANGVAKRARTAHRFKRVVRVLKRLCSEMNERGLLTHRAPSFLIESLVYAVEDSYFLVETDDRYQRVRRITLRIRELLSDPPLAERLMEVNGANLHFENGQAWTYQDAKIIVDRALSYLGNA